MKNALYKFSLLAIISLYLFSVTAAGQTKRRTAKTIEPTAKEAIKQVFLNGDILLSAARHCRSMGTSPGDKTVLDFLSGVLSFQIEPESKNAIEFTFKREKGKRGELVWVCDLMFTGGDAETPWSNGIRFKMRNTDRRLMRESLMCLGTG